MRVAGRLAIGMRTWWDLLSLYETLLVWPLVAFVGFALLRAKSRRRQVVLGVALFALFLPYVHRYVGDLYFDHLCETQAGEFIYRTVDNVEGILQMRPRDGSKDYFDRMRDGDIPEDPWGHTNWEAQQPETMFVNPPWSKYLYFETLVAAGTDVPAWERGKAEVGFSQADAKFKRFHGYDQGQKHRMRVDFVRETRSVIGYTWVSKPNLFDRVFNVYPGEVRVVDLATQEVLGRSRGFYRSRPSGICPRGKEDKWVYRFVSQVAKPPGTALVDESR